MLELNELKQLIKNYEVDKTNQNLLLEILDKANNEDVIKQILKHSMYGNSESVDRVIDIQNRFAEFKQYLDPKLLNEVVLKNIEVEQYIPMLVFLPEKLKEEYKNYYAAVFRLEDFDRKISDMETALSDFTKFKAPKLIGNLEELIQKATHIFKDQTEPIKIEKETYQSKINLDELKNKLQDKISNLSNEDLNILNYIKINPFTGRGSTPPVGSPVWDRIRKQEENTYKERIFSHFNDEKLIEELSNLRQNNQISFEIQ